MHHRPVTASLLLGAAVVLDRALKALVRSGLDWRPTETAGVWLTENRGIAFSLPLPSDVTATLVTVVLIALLALAVRRWQRRQAWLPYALLVLGGASNLFDRLRYGSVTDYVHLGPLPAFNLADTLVVLGLLLLMRETLIPLQPPTQRGTVRSQDHTMVERL